MNVLEFFYENPPLPRGFIPRKQQLKKGNTLLYGGSQSGKTYLVLDYLHTTQKKFLYLDMQDLRLEKQNLLQLDHFIQSEAIEIVAIDNYDQSIAPPKASRQNILICRKKLTIAHYQHQKLYPFDFEEFLATTQKNATHTFNLYLKNGTFDPSLQTAAKALFEPNMLHLFCYLCSQCSKTISVNQIYLNLKKEIKISKDWLYKAIKELEDENYIFFVAKKDAAAAAKKLFITHHAFVNALTLNVGFIYIFHNLFVNELLKKGYTIEYEQSGAYIVDGEKLLLLEPFGSEEAVWVKIQKRFGNYKKMGIRSITAITVSISFEFEIDSIICEAMPFYEWAVLDEF